MNVNGRAGSIELYLGEDVLRDGGKLMPVHWSAFNPGIGKWQGAISDKKRLYERFKAKLSNHAGGTHPTNDPDWSGMRAIMATIFSAFHSHDKKIILAGQFERYERY
jgi:hypothetical protein